MNILNALLSIGPLGIMFDQHQGVVRAWTLFHPFQNGKTMSALKRFFPCLEVNQTSNEENSFIRLGGFSSLSEAIEVLVNAKLYSRSPAVQGLHRVDVPEGIETITQFAPIE